MPDEQSPNDTFFRRAFWSVMGLGGTGIVASVGCVWKMSVGMASLEANGTVMREQIEKLLLTSYTREQAGVDQQNALADRRRLDEAISEITRLRIWQATIEGRDSRSAAN